MVAITPRPLRSGGGLFWMKHSTSTHAKSKFTKISKFQRWLVLLMITSCFSITFYFSSLQLIDTSSTTADDAYSPLLSALIPSPSDRNNMNGNNRSRRRVEGVLTTTTKTNNKNNKNITVIQYNICNGLSNQLLIHSAAIAIASELDVLVEIPNYFIVNGIQTSNENIIPTDSNSISFDIAFDKDYFINALHDLGIRHQFITFDFTTTSSSSSKKKKKPIIKCPGLGMLPQADPTIVRNVLNAFRPSHHLQSIIDHMMSSSMLPHNHLQQQVDDEQSSTTTTSTTTSKNTGICVHHRDGDDWHDHCNRWSSIADGVYRGNCLGISDGRSFLESLQDRGLTNDRWVYYCGDKPIPDELLKSSGYSFLSRNELMPEKMQRDVQSIKTDGVDDHGVGIRDLWALIDFFVCRRLDKFIGNSVSTFSAIQIALREGDGAFWYNSQSIPLAEMWPTYQLPIVYTYTENSMVTGKTMLKTSIASVRAHMPENKIHVLYHGEDDRQFRNWLRRNNVIVHTHNPLWKDSIEQMRRNGDAGSSHLFLHAGNYLGTWQRIDIPLFLDSEYCLFLDSDTLIQRSFTLADFGLNLTSGIALSSEVSPTSKEPSNAGVMLMNIPYLRRTYRDFLKFILTHVESAKFDHPSPSDQGAYLVFYANQTSFLDRSFNFKPYWPLPYPEFRDSFILHFHGPKPQEYLNYIMGKGCNKAIATLCRQAVRRPLLWRALKQYAMASYCLSTYQNPDDAASCFEIFQTKEKQTANRSQEKGKPGTVTKRK